MSLLHCYCTALLTAGYSGPSGGRNFRKSGAGRWGPVTRTVRFGLDAGQDACFPVDDALDNRPTRKQGPPPSARIDNSPPPVCTRSVRLSIGHQGTMKHRSPLSNLTPSRYALRVQRLPWRPIPGHEPNADPGYDIVKRIRFYTAVWSVNSFHLIGTHEDFRSAPIECILCESGGKIIVGWTDDDWYQWYRVYAGWQAQQSVTVNCGCRKNNFDNLHHAATIFENLFLLRRFKR